MQIDIKRNLKFVPYYMCVRVCITYDDDAVKGSREVCSDMRAAIMVFHQSKVYSAAANIALASSVISIHTSVKTIRSVMLSAGPE